MRKYEIMYIIRPDIEEEAQTALIERLNSVLTDNGAEIENVEEMGKKRFAYEIDNYRDGYYVLINFESTYEAVEEFDRQAKFSEDVVRHLIVREDDQ
ncbi:MAG TPA: 30S ribosomal protein S6 [Bacillota bacterium]|nr:30S ribosomal protein S6 [Bacillota bacterium]